MNREGYEKMCYDIIQNHNWYRPIPVSFVTESASEYKGILLWAFYGGLIDADMFKFLDTTCPRTIRSQDIPPF